MIEIDENDVIIIISTTLLEGGRGEIKIILDCFQIVYYDLTISLNIFCEGLRLYSRKYGVHFLIPQSFFEQSFLVIFHLIMFMINFQVKSVSSSVALGRNVY